MAEFAYNNAPSATTGTSPFFANKGYHPNLTIHLEQDLASSCAKNLVVNLDELHQELKATIAEAQKHTTWPSKKLSDKFLGPFEILAQHGSHSYTLRLPDSIRGVHPIFHVSMLEPATPNEIPNRVSSPLMSLLELCIC